MTTPGARTVLVTGAAKGIGAAVARRFAADGCNLVLMDVDAAGLAAMASSLRVPASTLSGSVADADACATAVKLAERDFGGLDVLSHNAGIQRYGDAETTTKALWDEVMAVNLTAAYLLAHAAIAALRRARGAAVFMSSCQGMAAQRDVLAYAVAKHGLIGLVRSMAVDEARHGVRVNGVAPGAIDTPMLRASVDLAEDPAKNWALLRAMHPLGRVGLPEEVADVVAFLASDQSRFVTGDVIRVDGGLLAQIPGSPTAAETEGSRDSQEPAA